VRVRGVFLKILLWFWASLVLVAVALELAITATSTPVEVRVHRFSDNALSSRAREAVAVLDRQGPPGVRRFLDDFERATGIHAVLLDAAGQAIAGRPIPAKATALAARALDSGQTEMEAEGQTALKARAVGVDGGRRYVLVASLPIGLMRLLRDAPSAQVLRLVAVLGTAAVACYGLARHVARPLATLQAATRELARGNLAVRVGPAMGRRRDEFAGLAQDFDRMAERLDALVTAERRLLRDISHELRSPLARLYVALGLARHEAGPERAGLDRIEREAERLNTLIGQLLTLARLESGTTGPAREAVELASIARERTTGGVGLGLTIAHRTIRLHGGTLAAANAPDGGLVVELGLPAPAADLRPPALTGSSQTA
jgi:two-component system, OmpR family, sensor histidine kinase CpxA